MELSPLCSEEVRRWSRWGLQRAPQNIVPAVPCGGSSRSAFVERNVEEHGAAVAAPPPYAESELSPSRPLDRRGIQSSAPLPAVSTVVRNLRLVVSIVSPALPLAGWRSISGILRSAFCFGWTLIENISHSTANKTAHIPYDGTSFCIKSGF